MRVLLLWLLVFSLFETTGALSRPPQSRDEIPEGFSVWVKELKVPAGVAKGISCCDVSDCRLVRVRRNVQSGLWEAFIARAEPGRDSITTFVNGSDSWEPVPQELVGKPSAFAMATACWSLTGALVSSLGQQHFFCFNPPSES